MFQDGDSSVAVKEKAPLLLQPVSQKVSTSSECSNIKMTRCQDSRKVWRSINWKFCHCFCHSKYLYFGWIYHEKLRRWWIVICDFVSFVPVQLELAELNLISFKAPYCKVQCMCFQLIQSRKDNSVCWINITSTVESGIYVVLWYFLNIPYLLCGFKLFVPNKCSRF